NLLGFDRAGPERGQAVLSLFERRSHERPLGITLSLVSAAVLVCAARCSHLRMIRPDHGDPLLLLDSEQDRATQLSLAGMRRLTFGAGLLALADAAPRRQTNRRGGVAEAFEVALFRLG